MQEHCVIVGAGHGGVQLAASLRQEAYDGRITLVSGEPDLPYHKPPLSKGFLKAPDAPVLMLRHADFYRDNAIDLILGETVAAIERQGKTITLASGAGIAYTKLVLATGARARLPNLEGTALKGVMSLRNLADARTLSDALGEASAIAIIGGGYIGMELAHTVAGLGRAVTVLEAAPRLLARVVAPEISHHVHDRSIVAGITIRTGVQIRSLKGMGGKVTQVELAGERPIPADVVILGTGALPNIELACDADLAIADGIAADRHLRTSDPDILALGDCVSFEQFHAGRRLRLECVQNATDQARHVAKTLTNRPAPYRELPWFWSDQGDMKLQTAGLALDADRTVMTGSPEENAFAVHHFREGRLIAADTINRPADHMLARRLLAAQIPITPADVAAGQARLKEMLKETVT